MTTFITAHAGCENTQLGSVENLYAALQYHADAIELDLRYDGEQVILSHDPVQANRRDYITLSAALGHLQGSALWFNCDLKEEAAFEPTLRCFHDRGLLSRLVFTGSYPLAYDDRTYPYRVFVNLENIPGIHDGMLQEQDACAAADWFTYQQQLYPMLTGLNAHYQTLRTQDLELFRTRSIPLMCWTVDSAPSMKELFRARIYAITTNQVRIAVDERRQL